MKYIKAAALALVKNALFKINAANDLRKDISNLAATTTANITNDVWMTHGNHTLKLSDKVTIEHDEEMTDKCMQMAQHLVKIQFLVVGGLQ